MQVANTSKFVLVLGSTQMEPGRTASLSAEMSKHPALPGLRDKGYLSILGAPQGPPQHEEATRAPVAEPAPQTDLGALWPPEEGEPSESVDDDLPQGWQHLGTNACKAFVKRCNDLELLTKLLVTERRSGSSPEEAFVKRRPKVVEALKSKISMLETTR